MSLFGIIDFDMPAHSKEEIRALHEKNINVSKMDSKESIEKLTEDLLYDRQWCKEHGIDYYYIKSEEVKIAENFVVNSIFNLTYTENGNSQA